MLCARNVVEPFKQATLAHLVDLEFVCLAFNIGHGLRGEINADLSAGLVLQLAANRGAFRFRERQRQQPVFGAVSGKDVAKARCDHAADAEFIQRIHRSLSRGAAAEVAVGDDDAGLVIRRGIEHELGLRTVGFEARVVEQDLAVLRSARHFVEACRAQLVGVDVRLVHGNGDCGECGKWLHVCS